MSVCLVDGRFDGAALEALCVDNAAPSAGDINQAKAALPGLLAVAANFLDDYPVGDGYVRQQEAFKHVSRMMEVAGWTFCGSGYYSAAFFKGGLTIKIGFKPADSALPYAAWCRANQGRPGVPVIHALRSEGMGYGILMDRLEPLVQLAGQGEPCYDPILAAEFATVQSAVNLGDDRDSVDPGLSATALAIRAFFEGIANFDVHSGNVMLDRLGNIVITDPVSFVGDTLSNEGTYDSPAYAYGS